MDTPGTPGIQVCIPPNHQGSEHDKQRPMYWKTAKSTSSKFGVPSKTCVSCFGNRSNHDGGKALHTTVKGCSVLISTARRVTSVEKKRNQRIPNRIALASTLKTDVIDSYSVTHNMFMSQPIPFLHYSCWTLGWLKHWIIFYLLFCSLFMFNMERPLPVGLFQTVQAFAVNCYNLLQCSLFHSKQPTCSPTVNLVSEWVRWFINHHPKGPQNPLNAEWVQPLEYLSTSSPFLGDMPIETKKTSIKWFPKILGPQRPRICH